MVADLLLEVGGVKGGKGGRGGEGGGMGWQVRGLEELKHAGHKQVLLLPTQPAAAQDKDEQESGASAIGAEVAQSFTADPRCSTKKADGLMG